MAEESDVTDFDESDKEDDLIPEGKEPEIFDERHGLYNAPKYDEQVEEE